MGEPLLEGPWLVVTFLALSGLALLSWSLKALDAAGAVAAFLLGLFVAYVAGLPWLVLMTLFTVLGVLATLHGKRRKEELGLAEAHDGERTWRNVVANGAAAAVAAAALLVVDPLAAGLAFAVAIAAVTADTMASEVGSLAGRARRIVPPFAPQRPGTNGAVSLRGQVAAAVGAGAIAVAAIWLVPIPPRLAFVPAIGGFVGCQIDSILGATLERDEHRDGPLSKQGVNFIASLVPAMVVLGVAAMV